MSSHLRVFIPTLLAFILLSGCMSFELSSNASKTEESINTSETVHGTLYGSWYWRDYNIQKCHDGALAKVEYTYTTPQLAISALTLGIYLPQTVEWWCADPGGGDDSNEPGLNPGDESG